MIELVDKLIKSTCIGTSLRCWWLFAHVGIKLGLFLPNKKTDLNTTKINPANSGYEWDTGVHYVGESQHQDTKRSTGRVLKFLTDGELKWEAMDDVFDTVKLRRAGDDETESFPIEKRSVNDGTKTWDTFRAMLIERFPEEEAAIDQFIAAMFDYKKAGMAIGLYKLLPRWLLKIAMTFGLHTRFLDNTQLTTTTREFLDSITDNEKLKCVLSYSYGDYGTVPSESPLFMNMALFG